MTIRTANRELPGAIRTPAGHIPFRNSLFAIRCSARAAVILGALFLPGCHDDPLNKSSVKRVFGATGLGPGEFSYPRAIAVSPVDGCVFVVDKTARIQRFSPDGDYQHQWRMPEYRNGKPTGLYVDRDNRVFVADTHYSRVLVFDREGRELSRFGSHGEGPGQFVFPTNVTIDREGFIYVGEYGGNDRISKFSPQGAYLMSFADKQAGEAWVERPTGMVFDEQDVLWVADSCHHRICRFDRSGRFLSAFGSPGDGPDKLSYPYGLILEPGGTLLIADRCNNRLVRYYRDGRIAATWGGAGRAIGQLMQPWGVARSADGRVYCLDSWNNRVQVIDW